MTPESDPRRPSEPKPRVAMDDAGHFSRLPDRIEPASYVEVQDIPPTPDPTMGRNTDQDAALRAGG